MISCSRWIRSPSIQVRKQQLYHLSTSIQSKNERVLTSIYEDQVKIGNLKSDTNQIQALILLDQLYSQLIHYKGPRKSISTIEETTSVKTSSWWRKYIPIASNTSTKDDIEPIDNIPQSIYMHGGVGCGKTFLMDLFYHTIPIHAKKRVHFHQFMLHIHAQMHQLRQQGTHGDPIPYIVDQILQDTWFLCFDEFQVTDVADALILRRLFSELLQKGMVMIATSNRRPIDLYKNGIQRHLFLPFIDLLKEKCEIISMETSTTDYRTVKGLHLAKNVYTCPINSHTESLFQQEFQHACHGEKVERIVLRTQGRDVIVPEAVRSRRVCQFTFDQLCRTPLGAADYYAIANDFSVIFVRNVPQFTLNNVNELRRFITFVDCMYDQGIRLHCLASAIPNKLFQVDTEAKAYIDEVFAFDRTVSRLLEMGSEDYLHAHDKNWKQTLQETSNR